MIYGTSYLPNYFPYMGFENSYFNNMYSTYMNRQVESRQEEVLEPKQQKMDNYQNRKDIYNEMESKLNTVFQKADQMDEKSDFDEYSATSSNTAVLTASANSSTREGSYDLSISNLAKSHDMLLGVDDGDSTTGVTAGISDPSDTSMISDDTTLSFYHNGNEYSYKTDSETTLNSLASRISDAENGVYADVVNIGSDSSPEYVMKLGSRETGAGEKRITTDSGGTNPGVNFSSTLYSGNSTEQETVQPGENSAFTVDGTSYTRTGNTVDDVIEGVSLGLLQEGKSATVDVTLDKEAIADKASDLVSAYNDFQSFVNDKNGVSAPLTNDSLAGRAANEAEEIMTERVVGAIGEDYQYLSEIGIHTSSGDKLEFDHSQFKEALENNPQNVRELFTGDLGVAGGLKSFVNEYSKSYNSDITEKIQSIDEQLQSLNDEYAAAENNMGYYRESITQKYSNISMNMVGIRTSGILLNKFFDVWG